MTHLCVGKLTIIGSDNGLSPGRRKAIIWINAGILVIGHLGTNFSEKLVGIEKFSLKKIRLKMSSTKCCPLRLGFNVLTLSLSLWGLDKRLHFVGIIFKCIFLFGHCPDLIHISWNLLPRVQLSMYKYSFMQWLGAEEATSHYLNQIWKYAFMIYWYKVPCSSQRIWD